MRPSDLDFGLPAELPSLLAPVIETMKGLAGQRGPSRRPRPRSRHDLLARQALFSTAQIPESCRRNLIRAACACVRGPVCLTSFNAAEEIRIMNNIVWLVGAVVIVLFILGFLGLR